MEFISIPAGSFTMGSPETEEVRGDSRRDDENQVPVTITQAFELGKTVVTQKQWIEVMETTPWKAADEDEDSDEDEDEDPPTPEGDNYPAVSISWDDATEFCAKLTALEHKSGKLPANQTYRLPTEAEWEYACRAGTTTAFSCGDEDNEIELVDYAYFYGDNDYDYSEPLEVATLEPNPWGLFDMHGNVWEWCEDWYEKSLSGGNDPKGPSAGSDRVVRGGDCGSYASGCRSASRGSNDPARRGNDNPADRRDHFGFRIVRVLL